MGELSQFFCSICGLKMTHVCVALVLYYWLFFHLCLRFRMSRTWPHTLQTSAMAFLNLWDGKTNGKTIIPSCYPMGCLISQKLDGLFGSGMGGGVPNSRKLRALVSSGVYATRWGPANLCQDYDPQLQVKDCAFYWCYQLLANV